MAKTEPEFLDYLRELLVGVPDLRMRAMFGGHGVYSGDFMFGLVADDELYLKVDDANREQFLAEGCEPFIYNKQGKDMAMSYYRVPESALEDPQEMLRWARLGIDAALRKTGSRKKKR